MSSTPTIVKAQGLCNRIKTYMSALCNHEKVGTEVYADSYIFPSLTYNDGEVENPICGWRLNVSSDEEQYIEKYKTIDFLYEKTPKYFVDKYSNIIKSIEINPDILEYVDDFTRDWENVIGLHIRSWWADGERSTWHDNLIYEEELDKIDSNTKIFLCSDNFEVIDYFFNKYGERVIVHPQKLHDRKFNPLDQYHNDIQLIVDGFIDCLILSKCATIVGTWGSTFTEVAWWFSGCNSNVIIPKPNNIHPKFEKDFFVPK